MKQLRNTGFFLAQKTESRMVQNKRRKEIEERGKEKKTAYRLSNRIRGPYCKFRTEFFPVDL